METDNILIAKFMGEKLPYINNQGRFEHMVEGAGLISSTNAEDLYRFLRYNYNTDWNRLMQVVEKIFSLDDYYHFKQTLGQFDTSIRDRFPNKEGVYNQCIEFIKWYNENSAKEK